MLRGAHRPANVGAIAEVPPALMGAASCLVVFRFDSLCLYSRPACCALSQEEETEAAELAADAQRRIESDRMVRLSPGCDQRIVPAQPSA